MFLSRWFPSNATRSTRPFHALQSDVGGIAITPIYHFRFDMSSVQQAPLIVRFRTQEALYKQRPVWCFGCLGTRRRRWKFRPSTCIDCPAHQRMHRAQCNRVAWRETLVAFAVSADNSGTVRWGKCSHQTPAF